MAFQTLSANAGTNFATTTGSVPILAAQYNSGQWPIVFQQWTQISGPDCVIADPVMAVTPLYELSAGTYVFQFFVRDSYQNTASSQVTVTCTQSGGPVFQPDPYPYHFQ